MITQDDVKQEDLPEGVDAKVVEEYVYWRKIERVEQSVIYSIIGTLSYVMICCLTVYIYSGLIGKPNKPLGFITLWVLGISLVWSLLLLIPNFKPSKPVRIMREAIWLFVILCVVIALRYLTGCLFGGGFHFRGLYSLSFILLGGAIAMAFVTPLWNRPRSLKRRIRKFLSKELAGREKEMKRMQNWLGRKVDAVVRSHPSLILTSEKEFVVLYGRYMVWALMLSVLALEAYLFARRFFA